MFRFETGGGVVKQAGVAKAASSLGYFLATDALRTLDDAVADASSLEEANNLLGQSVGFLRQASDHGLPDAQLHLGEIYENGAGQVTCDKTLALSLYRCAAESGNTEAAFRAANMLFHAYRAHPASSKSRSSMETVLDLYELAANAGHIDAQNALGIIHEDGLGVPQNLETAQQWFKTAADNGNADACINLAALLERTLALHAAPGSESQQPDASASAVAAAMHKYRNKGRALGHPLAQPPKVESVGTTPPAPPLPGQLYP